MPQRLLLTNNDGTETIDLLAGSLRVMNWGWDTQPTSLQQRITQLPFGIQASSLGYPQVVETLSLATFGCQDEIRAAIRELEEFLENAKSYMDDPVDGDPHWLEWRSKGEAGKRALVCGGTWQWYSRPPSAWQMIDGEVLLLKLALTRHPLWEDVDEASDDTGGVPLSSVGGTWAFTATEGRVPARLQQVQLTNETDQQAVILTDLWMGWRQENEGLTAFDPLWECEESRHGIFTSADVAEQADANASPVGGGGDVARVTFTDDELNQHLYIRVYDVLGGTAVDASHFAGRYLVLCRCKSSDTSEDVIVQMRSGYTYSNSWMTHDPIAITSSQYLYYELGEVQIPAPGLWGPTSTTTFDLECALFTIALWAGSPTWGTGNTHYLDLDCLVLIPTDYFIRVEEAKISDDVIGDLEALCFDGDNDNVNCGSGATLDSLPSADMTAEAWIRRDEEYTGWIMSKLNATQQGWSFRATSQRLYVSSDHITDNAITYTDIGEFNADGIWHHVAAVWDQSELTWYIAVDGEWPGVTTQVGVGAYLSASDNAGDFRIGNRPGNDFAFHGCIGWVRLSDAIRYTPGIAFTPPGRCSTPGVDGDTVELWLMSEGAGGTAAASVTSPANDGIITEAVWSDECDVNESVRITDIYRNPDERIFGYVEGYGGAARASVIVQPNQWYLPIGDSLLVLAAQRETAQVITDTVDVYAYWYPRWTSYRE
jgi:hypothetical protein